MRRDVYYRKVLKPFSVIVWHIFIKWNMQDLYAILCSEIVGICKNCKRDWCYKQISFNWLIRKCIVAFEAHHSSVQLLYNPHGCLTVPAHQCWWLSPVCPQSGSRSWCQLSSESLWSQAPYPGACPRWLWPPRAAGSTSEKKPVSGDHNRGRPLKHHVSEKHVNPGCVTQSVMFFFLFFPLISCSCLSPNGGFWISYCAPACVWICGYNLRHMGTPTKHWWSFLPGNTVVVVQLGVGWPITGPEGLTRPRGGGETGASSRGKAGEAL